MSKLTRADVTAVKLYKNYVIAGIGSFLHIFDRQQATLLTRTQCLQGERIHGLVVAKEEDKILAFGGKQFTIVDIKSSNTGDDFIRSFEPVVCDDWLLSALWIDDVTIAVVTAHNVVQKWDVSAQKLSIKHPSKTNSVMYCSIMVPVENTLMVFAGTMFSEVFIQICGDTDPLHVLEGHRGVIFSMQCDPEKELIVTTSDDRSVCIWGIDNIKNHQKNTIDYWKNAIIECKYEVYGHSSRVMRNFITNDFIISVGEDSSICFWNHKGSLIRKLQSHQNSVIWSLDADETHLVTGGGDSGIVIHPLTVAGEYGEKYTFNVNNGVKNIGLTARNNLVILHEKPQLIYYDLTAKTCTVHTLKDHKTSFRLLSISSCKQFVAVTELNGKLDIFVENCKNDACLSKLVDMKLNIGKVMSMKFAGNRHLVFCNEKGEIKVLTVNGTEVIQCLDFLLPPCKEKSFTSVALNLATNTYVIGDRSGDIHIYTQGFREPVKTFKRVHGKYGPTSITTLGEKFMTTGRDGTIRYFLLKANNSRYLSRKELEFQWPEKFLDRDETKICGFQERVFVVFNASNNMKLLEMPCGGGHRAWDATRYYEKVDNNFEECISLVYVKNFTIHVYKFQLNKIVSKVILNGSHSKNVNCLKVWFSDLDPTVTYVISGGEDTTLRLSSLTADLKYKDEWVSKHLSNIRAVKLLPYRENMVLVFSAGGRAQICVNSYEFQKTNDSIEITTRNLTEYMICGTDDDRKRKAMNFDFDFNPETRIMDLDVVQITTNNFLVFAGCSDSYFRVFNFTINQDSIKLYPILLKQEENCILKTTFVRFKDQSFMATCTTRGILTLWHISDTNNMSYRFKERLHRSGINTFAYIEFGGNLLIATGGDDNVIKLHLLQDFVVLKSFSIDKYHSSQITGLCLLDDVLVSASIDQRITIFHWSVSDDINCKYVKQVASDIPDLQGIEVLKYDKDNNEIEVCVFGKGMEVLKLSTVEQD